ncbi:MAG: hypothetical protein KME20_01455 [Kaiparowitsia implicata GSE-PSE-MK54-09C]|jgi:hypothetical protein|nr:hypothetical protein [Kaiparowitsia implicata GSE-PSE-MK54-09C]
MNDETEILLKMHEEQWIHARHSEDQRATVTNLVITLASAGIAFIAQTGLNPTKLPITVLLIVLGFYGAFTSEKLSERSRYHIVRARLLRKRIDELNPNAKLEQLKEEAETYHKTRDSSMYEFKLHYLWLALHLAIAFTGIFLTLIVLR